MHLGGSSMPLSIGLFTTRLPLPISFQSSKLYRMLSLYTDIRQRPVRQILNNKAPSLRLWPPFSWFLEYCSFNFYISTSPKSFIEEERKIFSILFGSQITPSSIDLGSLSNVAHSLKWISLQI